MSNKNVDNVIDVASYLLKRVGVKHTENHLSKQLQTHPFYPSLAAVNDVFTGHNIECEAYRASYKDLLTCQTPFITHLTIDNNVFVVVEKVTEDAVLFYYGGKYLKSIKKEDFIEVWDNIIFQAKPSSIREEPDYVKHHRKEQLEKAKIPAMVSFVLFAFLFLVLTKFSIAYLIPLFFAKIIGLFFAILLVKQEMGYHSEIADKLCTMSKSTGCNEVLHSKVSKLFGNILLADAGLIWFVTSSLYLFFISTISVSIPVLNLLGWLAICTVPMILFSIGYQIFIIKKYCPLCLGVMLILAIEVILFPVIYDFRFQLPQISEIIMLCSSLCIISFIWVELKQLLVRNISLQNSEVQYLRLRRNPAVIQSQLMESADIEISNLPNPISLTDNNAYRDR